MSPTASGIDGEAVWADAHNHIQDSGIAGCAPVSTPCIVNATCEEDWADVLAIVADAPCRHAALGIHPWFAATARAGWDDRLCALLDAHPAAGIGECGLDSKTRECALDVQLPVFARQIRLARELDRPLTIHCVGAWGRLFEMLDREPPPSRWLLHSFNGSEETAGRLAAMGAYFSISGRALHPAGEKILAVFKRIPPDRILLETDAPNQPPPAEFIARELSGGLNAPENLGAIGAAVAGRFGFTAREFAALTRGNYQKFLGGDLCGVSGSNPTG